MIVPSPRLKVRDISLIAILAALCVGWSYALIGLPNINAMDLVVFVTGFVFGAPIGVVTGVLAWSVYGIVNPLGFNVPVWLSTAIGETIFGIAGGILGRVNYDCSGKSFNIVRFSLEMGLWGLILTVIYDLFTNLAYAVAFEVPVAAAIVSGWALPPWFGILHEASNLILFFSAVYPLTTAIKRLRGGDNARVNASD